MNGIVGSKQAEAPVATHVLNQWIIGETVSLVTELDRALAAYRFDEAAGAVYRFIWDQFCDWYLELTKPILQTDGDPAADETRAVAGWVLAQILVCLHPFMPFITEELWHAMIDRPSYDLITARWPRTDVMPVNAAASDEINWLISVISQIRSARTELNVAPSAQLPLSVSTQNSELFVLLDRHSAAIKRLARVSDIQPSSESEGRGQISVAVGDAVYRLPVEGVIDIAAEQARLRKAIEKLEKDIHGISGRLNNPAFVAKAPPEVIDESREILAETQQQQARLREALARIAA
jgi:valyl-tRNA synthetase